MPSALITPVSGGSPSPIGSLTASARPFPEDADWQAFGTEHDPEACQQAWVWQKCSEVDGETVEAKPLNTGIDAVRFQPFLIEANAASCAGLPGDHETLEARAKRTLQWNASRQIDRALSSATPDGYPNINPNLPGVADDITPGGGPSSLVNTVCGLLQDGIDCGLTGDLFIHAPHWTLPHWLSSTLVVQAGSVLKMGGHTIVLDQGFANEPPTGSGAAGVGQAWVYLSSPIEVAVGPVVIPDQMAGGFALRRNEKDVLAMQLGIYRFDACCVKAALAQVC